MSESTHPSKRSHPCKGMTKEVYRAYRQNHVKLWQASGLSKSDYANQIGVSKDAVRDWVRDFGSKTTQPKLSNLSTPKQTQTAATLVPVRIQPSIQSNVLKLTRPDGIALEWHEPPTATWLAELLRSMA